ncbi:succinyl-diaminopimelate desuccinylase [Bartonella sp. DGB1]|uniref:succinyl-diaminopimelate desuccinylase n=1 Tax=Bartonella sp. DGB1 TaxID=3239807 RepID=UPI0035239FA5
MFTATDIKNPIFLTQELLKINSVTPNSNSVIELFSCLCKNIGINGETVIFSDNASYDVANFYGSIGSGGPHLMYSGHLDVVPPGNINEWKYDPFGAIIDDNLLYGRGAVDMKGGLASMLASVARFLHNYPNFPGKISFLVTGDEESLAINGTKKLLAWAAEKNEKWDAAINGEPTSVNKLGDTIKIGRRGSLSAILKIKGKQGHVAYPQLANNPLPTLLDILQIFIAQKLDNGNENFDPSNLELTSIDTGNDATNVIPMQASASFNIRFNDNWTSVQLIEKIETILAEYFTDKDFKYKINWIKNPSESFIANSPKLVNNLSQAIEEITNIKTRKSTSGGTSDARFIKNYCPVIDFGLTNKTMHAVNEAVDITDLEELTKIYYRFLEIFFQVNNK